MRRSLRSLQWFLNTSPYPLLPTSSLTAVFVVKCIKTYAQNVLDLVVSNPTVFCKILPLGDLADWFVPLKT